MKKFLKAYVEDTPIILKFKCTNLIEKLTNIIKEYWARTVIFILAAYGLANILVGLGLPLYE